MPARKKWWTEAFKTIYRSRAYAILENPDAVKDHDDMLIKDFWPSPLVASLPFSSVLVGR